MYAFIQFLSGERDRPFIHSKIIWNFGMFYRHQRNLLHTYSVENQGGEIASSLILYQKMKKGGLFLFNNHLIGTYLTCLNQLHQHQWNPPLHHSAILDLFHDVHHLMLSDHLALVHCTLESLLAGKGEVVRLDLRNETAYMYIDPPLAAIIYWKYKTNFIEYYWLLSQASFSVFVDYWFVILFNS